MPDPTPASPPPDPTLRVLRNLGGIALLLLGIVGLVLPVLQCVLFVVGGLWLIDLPIKRRMHRWLLRFHLYRQLSHRLDALSAKGRNWLRRRAPKHPHAGR